MEDTVLYTAPSGRALRINMVGELSARNSEFYAKRIFCNENIAKNLEGKLYSQNTVRLGPVLRTICPFTEFNSKISEDPYGFFSKISFKLSEHLETNVNLVDVYNSYSCKGVQKNASADEEIVLYSGLMKICIIQFTSGSIQVITDSNKFTPENSSACDCDICKVLDILGPVQTIIYIAELIQVLAYKAGVWLTWDKCGHINGKRRSHLQCFPENKICTGFNSLVDLIACKVFSILESHEIARWQRPIITAYNAEQEAKLTPEQREERQREEDLFRLKYLTEVEEYC